MRSTKIIAAIGALFIGNAASAADITARYVMPAIGNAVMIVEADDHGNSRISVDDGTAVITTNGVAYVISTDGEGRFVVRREDMMAAVRELARQAVGAPDLPPEPSAALARLPAPTEAGPEIVAGRPGTRWIIEPDAPPQADVMDVVLSADPELAPIGRALAAQFDESASGVGTAVGSLGLRGDVPPLVKALLGRGTILRYGQMARLESVAVGPIADSAFTLPAAPLTRAEFAARVNRFLTRRD
jgi:co-chaperonin GroES (HSP10)